MNININKKNKDRTCSGSLVGSAQFLLWLRTFGHCTEWCDQTFCNGGETTARGRGGDLSFPWGEDIVVSLQVDAD